MIIENLGALYVANIDIMNKLREANRILQDGKINESAESLHVSLLGNFERPRTKKD